MHNHGKSEIRVHRVLPVSEKFREFVIRVRVLNEPHRAALGKEFLALSIEARRRESLGLSARTPRSLTAMGIIPPPARVSKPRATHGDRRQRLH